MSNTLLSAKLVWDGGDEVKVPECMGKPRADQMQGTPLEQLAELAGRVCYDSLGKGRPSFTCEQEGKKTEGYHDHIRATKNNSVLEHCTFTIEVSGFEPSYAAWICANRPGLFMRGSASCDFRLTVNLRAIVDWIDFCSPGILDNEDVIEANNHLIGVLRELGHQLAPQIICKPANNSPVAAQIAEPEEDNEKWISLFLSGSRGFSHEQVRHGDFTAISQRSTRYVDESESQWVEHPLLSKYRIENSGTNENIIAESYVTTPARAFYCGVAGTLEKWLIDRGAEKTSARKQARGAARGYLGNALYTEMIFSASVAQWKRMLRQRASVFADAEIREVYEHVLRELKASRYGDCFANWEPRPSPDGIGMIAIEK